MNTSERNSKKPKTLS